MFLDFSWASIDRSRRENSDTAGRHLRPSGGGYHQPKDAVCPSQKTSSLPCPCVENSLLAKQKVKRGSNLIISSAGNVDTWANEIRLAFGEDGGIYKVKVILLWNNAPKHLRHLCYDRARDRDDLMVDHWFQPKPKQTRIFIITTPQSGPKLMTAGLERTWKIQGRRSDGKQYGAVHNRIIFDEAHFFKRADSQMMLFIRGLNASCLSARETKA